MMQTAVQTHSQIEANLYKIDIRQKKFRHQWIIADNYQIRKLQSVCKRNPTFYQINTRAAVTHWLRCCATNLKVAGSIPEGVIGIFH